MTPLTSGRGTGTRAVFLARYHTLLRRDARHDPRARRLLARSMTRALAPVLPRDKSTPILDVGCGDGSLLALLGDRGYADLTGFDLSPENVELGRRLRLPVALHDALDVTRFQPARSYGAVFAIDLIEHLAKEDALPFLSALRRRIEPGGVVVVRTPNMGSLLGPLERYGDLTHEWGLNERSARDLMVAAGFHDVRVLPSWEAATLAGRARELYLCLLHCAVFAAAGSARPRIPTVNLLITGIAR